MHSFTQYMPTKVVFGKEAELQVGKLVKEQGASKVLIVYGGGSVVRSGLLDRIKDELKKESIEYMELPGVKPNPRLALAEEGVKKAIDFGAELILAVGGGSVIDTSKSIGIGAANPDLALWDDVWVPKKPVEKVLPIGVVLTISAAGSEMSDSVVLTNEAIGRKQGYNSDLVRPKFAVMNPELTYTLPKYQLTCGIVDILMHTLERYFTPVEGNQLTDEIAEGLMRTIIRNGKVAYQDQTDYDSMSEIMWCGSISHNGMTGLGGANDFSTHKLGHELSAMFDEAHGATLSALWGSWARYVCSEKYSRFAKYGEKVWGIEAENDETAAKLAIEATEEFFRSLDMPTGIGQMKCGLQSDETLKKLASSATKGNTFQFGSFKKIDEQGAYEIYRAANHE